MSQRAAFASVVVRSFMVAGFSPVRMNLRHRQ